MKTKFNFRKTLCLYGVAVALSSCSSDLKDDMIVAETNTKTVNVESITFEGFKEEDSNALELAKLIQKSRDKGILEKIQDETSKKFDGDYDILVAEILSKDENLHPRNISSSSIYKLLKGKGNEKLFKSILSKDPLLNIYMPDWDEEYLKKSKDFLIVIKPKSGNDKKEYSLYGINSKGETVILSSLVEPKIPYLVIGDNERVVINKTGNNLQKRGVMDSSFFETEYYSYFFKKFMNIDRKTNNLKKRDGGKFITSGKRSIFDRNKMDVIVKARFLGMDEIREVEGWGSGNPEVSCDVYYKSLGSITDLFTNTCRHINMGESGWYKGSSFWFSAYSVMNYGEWYVMNWVRTALPTKMVYHLYEEDAKFYIDGEVFGKDAVKVKIHNGDDIGYTDVFFKDNLGKWYRVGNLFKFQMGQIED